VNSLPIALFINLDKEGKISIGGYIYLLCIFRSMNIYPSVIYPVRSGIGCVISSLGIVRMGN